MLPEDFFKPQKEQDQEQQENYTLRGNYAVRDRKHLIICSYHPSQIHAIHEGQQLRELNKTAYEIVDMILGKIVHTLPYN